MDKVVFLVKIFFVVAFLGVLGGCANSNEIIEGWGENKEILSPSGLMVNLLTKPQKSFITTKKPTFSWIVPENINADFQSAFRILVASSKENLDMDKGDVWDSDKVVGAKSIHVPCGVELESGKSYFWKVRVWGRNGLASPYSQVQEFKTGIFGKKSAWKGASDWVEIDDRKWSFENRPPVEYFECQPVKKIVRKNVTFLDFGKAAFANLKIKISPEDAKNKTVKVRIGEQAFDGKINRKPTGFVIYAEYDLKIQDGKVDYFLQIPRFIPRYPHSQPMPLHMPEVIPFRYCEVDDVKVLEATQSRLHISFDDDAAEFVSSNKVLNAVYDLCKHSVKINTFNGDYASSQRERMMYESDTYIHQLGHYNCDREYAIARYSVENMIYHATWPTEWIMHSLLMAWADYMYTGDDSSLRANYQPLKAKTLIALTDSNSLISTRTGLMTPEFLKSIFYDGKKLTDIVDWPQGAMSPARPKGGETDEHDFRDYNTVVNAFHYKSLLIMADIADVLGNIDDAKFYKNRANSFKRIFNQKFFDEKNGVYIDGFDKDGKVSTHSSQHSNIFPLAFGLVEQKNLESVRNFVIQKKMACGVYTANYLLEALYENNAAKSAFQRLVATDDRSWWNMIAIGSTVTIESWDNKYKINNSWTHGWSASPAHIIPRKILGVEPLKAGFEKILLRPNPQGLDFAKGKVPTIRGSVYVDFKFQNNDFFYNFHIPANTTARLEIPVSSSAPIITVNGVFVECKVQNSKAIIDNIPSGTYFVVSKGSPIAKGNSAFFTVPKESPIAESNSAL